jgi:transposase InsO family protein
MINASVPGCHARSINPTGGHSLERWMGNRQAPRVIAMHNARPDPILPISNMSRRGDRWDKVVAESFFAALKLELIDRKPFESRRAARAVIFQYIEALYNRLCLHQTLDYRTNAAGSRGSIRIRRLTYRP